MTHEPLTRERVLERSAKLPGFHPIIHRILGSIGDPKSNTNELATLIEMEPLVTSQVLSRAFAVSSHSRWAPRITDVHGAVAMIGIMPVRQIAISSSYLLLFGENPPANHSSFIKHSRSVSACCKEIAVHLDYPVPAELAQIAGLLHDLGHLWLCSFEHDRFEKVIHAVSSGSADIEEAEIREFGVSHSDIGAWLAEHWALPDELISAIAHHHHPQQVPDKKLAALVHVAEVLSHALELPGTDHNFIHRISSSACSTLKLWWTDSSQELFRKIEAHGRDIHALSS